MECYTSKCQSPDMRYLDDDIVRALSKDDDKIIFSNGWRYGFH